MEKLYEEFKETMVLHNKNIIEKINQLDKHEAMQSKDGRDYINELMEYSRDLNNVISSIEHLSIRKFKQEA